MGSADPLKLIRMILAVFLRRLLYVYSVAIAPACKAKLGDSIGVIPLVFADPLQHDLQAPRTRAIETEYPSGRLYLGRGRTHVGHHDLVPLCERLQ